MSLWQRNICGRHIETDVCRCETVNRRKEVIDNQLPDRTVGWIGRKNVHITGHVLEDKWNDLADCIQAKSVSVSVELKILVQLHSQLGESEPEHLIEFGQECCAERKLIEH